MVTLPKIPNYLSNVTSHDYPKGNFTLHKYTWYSETETSPTTTEMNTYTVSIEFISFIIAWV